MDAEKLEVLRILFSAFGKTPTELQVKAYLLGLSEMSAELLALAVKQAISRCKFLPTVAELLEIAQPAKVSVAVAFETFDRMCDQAANGRGESIMCEDPALAATIKSLGGLGVLCRQPKEQFNTWTRKAFEDAYAGFRTLLPKKVQSEPLRVGMRGITSHSGQEQSIADIVAEMQSQSSAASRIIEDSRCALQ